MTAPSPRPTTEQVTTALFDADRGNCDEADARTLAAEVRAQRGELGLELGMRTAAVDELETLRRALWGLLGSEQQLADEEVLRRVAVAVRARPPGLVEIVDVGPGRGCARVEGRCPTCGVRSLFLGAGARVTCASLSCTGPCAVDDYLDGAGRAALAARTPQPAEPGLPNDALRGDRTRAQWVATLWRDWPQVKRDGVAALSWHLAEALEDLAVAELPIPAPLPAVSDKPDVTRSVGTLRRSGGNVDRWDGRRWVPTVIVAGSTRQGPYSEDEALQPAVPDGEGRARTLGDWSVDGIHRPSAEAAYAVCDLDVWTALGRSVTDPEVAEPQDRAARWTQMMADVRDLARPLDGDVLARFNAAADAVAKLGLPYCARLMRELAVATNVAHPDVRAAVAAALAPPAGVAP